MMIPNFHIPVSRLAICVCGMFGFAVAPGNGQSIVRFANGDQLSGSVESLTTERLVWKSPILEGPTTLRLDRILDVTLPGETPDFDAGHEATLSLTNGDTIRGQLASVTDDRIELDTWFAGRLEFRRVMVRSLEISERPKLLYRGPNGVAEWSQPEDVPAWTFQSGSLRSHSPGIVGREMELPEECSISFDAAWRGAFRLNVIFFSDDISTDRPENGYELLFQQRSVHLRKSGTHNFLGHTTNAGILQENERVRVEIRASLKTGMVALFLNGRIVEVWNDPDVAAGGFGKGIQFVSQNSSPVKISVIEVSSWDGVIDEMPDLQEHQRDRMTTEEPEPVPEEGRMTLRNGDSLKGEVLSITDGFITVQTEYSEVKLPVERLRNIALKPVEPEEPKRMNGDVRAWFTDGSALVFRLDEVKADTLVGFSQTFGTSEFKTSAFNRLEFNIYSLEMEEIRTEDSW